MFLSFIKYTFTFIALLFIQVTVLNNFTFLGWATPYLYIYFIIILPTNISKSWLFTLAFILGFSIDIFCNTPGMHSIAALTTAALREIILRLYFSTDEIESSTPSAFTYGLWRFMRYALTVVALHHFTLLVLESFVFLNFWLLIGKIIVSTLFSTLLIFSLETFKLSRR
ncbi:MAG: rod shape-determining protein MreD [Bacteroidales bacterium]